VTNVICALKKINRDIWLKLYGILSLERITYTQQIICSIKQRQKSADRWEVIALDNIAHVFGREEFPPKPEPIQIRPML